MSKLSVIKAEIARFLREDRGAEGAEKLLIIGAIVLPILGLLIVFRNNISEWVKNMWGDVKTDADTYDTSMP